MKTHDKVSQEVKDRMKPVFDAMADLFKGSLCPNCKEGRLKCEMLDMQFDKMVYKCNKCGKEYI